ncbi:MAG: hypothetical protein HP052_00455 [Firmicutes bacterium]|nr:hypothetical protein [Bacillota bacterium]
MKNIFLTGQVQCGKSTLIRRVLAALGPLSLGGFRSISVASAVPGAFAEVYLVPAADEHPALTRDNLIGIRWGGHGFNAYPAAFDNYGVQLLRSSAPAQLLLMDELGMMENAATLFAQAVIQCLDGLSRFSAWSNLVLPRCWMLFAPIRRYKLSLLMKITAIAWYQW